MFHTHIFIQSENPEVLYCTCGETRDLHQHKWEHSSYMFRGGFGPDSDEVVGQTLRCSGCGLLKNHRLTD